MWEVLVSQDETENIQMAQRQNEIQKHMQEPVVYAVIVNPDIMCLHEAMKAPNRDQFKRAMDKELQDHIAHDTIPTRNGQELGEIWVSKVGTNF